MTGRVMVTEVTVSFGETINLGDFNSGRLDISSKAKLEYPAEAGSAEHRAAMGTLAISVRKALRRLIKETYPDLD